MDIESLCRSTYNTFTACFDEVKDKSSKEAFKDSVETLFSSSMTYLTFSISLSYEDDEVIDRWKRKIRREAGEWYDDHIASKRKGSRYDDDDWDDDDYDDDDWDDDDYDDDDYDDDDYDDDDDY